MAPDIACGPPLLRLYTGPGQHWHVLSWCCSCEAALLQNQLPPKIPAPNDDSQITGDLAKLGDEIFEMYAALLVLRAGEIVLFEDMKRQLEKRPLCTRNVKQSIKDLRKKIRDYEHSVLNLTNEQKKWKGTLKAGKLNICRRARQQHNGLKEEAARLKHTIDLFNEEKHKLTTIAQNFENALNTTLGTSWLSQTQLSIQTERHAISIGWKEPSVWPKRSIGANTKLFRD